MEPESSRGVGQGIGSKEAGVSVGRRELKISGVQLRIVGEALNVLQEFKQKLELSHSCEGLTCRVCFLDGESFCSC